jgi:hypothetical protein
LLDAIQAVECGDRHASWSGAVGDEGRSLGPLQIQRAYWQDALAWEPHLAGRYSHVRGRVYARRVSVAYWQRYCPDIMARASRLTMADCERLARVHNGGPSGWRNPQTAQYWRRVRSELRK